MSRTRWGEKQTVERAEKPRRDTVREGVGEKEREEGRKGEEEKRRAAGHAARRRCLSFTSPSLLV